MSTIQAADSATQGQIVAIDWGTLRRSQDRRPGNEVHRILDVTFRDDDSRIPPGNAVEDLAVQRHIALNLLMRDTSAKRCLGAKRMKSACDGYYQPMVVTGQMPSPYWARFPFGAPGTNVV